MVRNQQASQDIESHFYVHPSEGPHSELISPKFNGSNYLTWSRSMQHALRAKNKLPFINGALPVPDDDDFNKTVWERCNHLVQSWLIASVSDSIAQNIVFHDTAFDVWQDLKERFSKVDRIRIAKLCWRNVILIVLFQSALSQQNSLLLAPSQNNIHFSICFLSKYIFFLNICLEVIVILRNQCRVFFLYYYSFNY